MSGAEFVKKKRLHIEEDANNEDATHSNANQRQLAQQYQQKEEQLKCRLNYLKVQFKQLEDGKLDEYNTKLKTIENEFADRLTMIKTWYQIKKQEIEYQFDIENKLAQNEYFDKRKELKDSLKHEYEEKRKYIENEKNSLDINQDTNEMKPTITRKLRRRVNQAAATQQQTSNNDGLLSLTFGGNLNTSVVTNVTNISNANTIVNNQNQLIVSATSLNTPINNVSSVVNVAGLNSTSISNTNNYYLQNILVQQEQQRKRRPSPSTQIFYTLNDDEICDDLKYLNKFLNVIPMHT